MQIQDVKFRSILCADWGKAVARRAVYLADVDNRYVSRVSVSDGWTLRSLLMKASQIAVSGPVLVAVDAPFGVPAGYLAAARKLPGWPAADNFIDLLRHCSRIPQFFHPTAKAEQWKLEQPFFAVPGGSGSLKAFYNAARADGVELLRSIDRKTKAKSLFITSGIPGSVGSATVSLWQELSRLLDGERNFAIWPFEGGLEKLCRLQLITLAEIYPRAAYATALLHDGREVCPPLMLAKTDGEKRRSALAALTVSQWVRANDVKLADLDHAQSCEDDFDACITVAALLRCQLEHLPLAEVEMPLSQIEGGILGTGSIDLSLKEKCWPIKLGKGAAIQSHGQPCYRTDADATGSHFSSVSTNFCRSIGFARKSSIPAE